MKFSVTVTLKKDVLDPQGKVVQNTLIDMGMNNLKSVRQGKHFEIEVDDTNLSSAEKKMRDIKSSPKEIAFKVGEIVGDRILEKKIKQKISFDRGPYLYHGRVEELAKGVRSKGIKF